MKDRRCEDNRHLHREKRKARGLMILCGWLMCVAAFVFGGTAVIGISGKYNLDRQVIGYSARTGKDVQEVLAITGDKKAWQEGRVGADGTVYHYNDDILTFLIMGIEREEEEQNSIGYVDGGNADALFLLVLDAREEVVKVIPINRSTMTEVNIYGDQGVREGTVTAQICTQYGYGDGGKLSCEYQVDAVGNLFYGIPINGYLAVDMEDVYDVAELIGGIKLEVNAAELSAEYRLERQKQFLTEVIMEVKERKKNDFTLPIRIYNEISDRAVTDITTDEVTYLAMAAGDYHFDDGQVITIPGKGISTKSNGDSLYDEFYVDEAAFYELVLDVFYEPAEQDGR